MHEYITLVHEYKYNKVILHNAKNLQAYKMFSDLVGYKEANSLNKRLLKKLSIFFVSILQPGICIQ